MNIKVNNSALNKYGNKIKSNSKDFERDIKNFYSIIESINSAWEGDDALKYINVMRDRYMKMLLETKQLLDDYGNYLNGAADSYEVLDEVFSSKNIDV